MVIRLKRCPRCLRNDVPRETLVCGKCGYAFEFHPPPPPAEPPPLPSPARWVAPAPHDITTATLASLFVTGAGQYYNHQSAKGALLFAVSCALAFLTIWLRSVDFLGLFLVEWVIAIADAAVVAGRLLDQQQVRPWQWF